jgi:hypothetical protein
MGQYSDEQKRQSIARARELLEQLNKEEEIRERGFLSVSDADEERPTWPTRRDILDPMTRSSERMRRWKREAEEVEARRAQEREMATNELNAQRTRDWERWADARIAAAQAEHDRALVKTLGQVVSELRFQLRKEFAEQIGQLRTEVVKARGVDDGGVVELPSPLIRKIRNPDAA